MKNRGYIHNLLRLAAMIFCLLSLPVFWPNRIRDSSDLMNVFQFVGQWVLMILLTAGIAAIVSFTFLKSIRLKILWVILAAEILMLSLLLAYIYGPARTVIQNGEGVDGWSLMYPAVFGPFILAALVLWLVVDVLVTSIRGNRKPQSIEF